MRPPPYPRIPHLVPGRGTRDDRVLGTAELASLLAREVVVEEKLDGANAAMWLEVGAVQVALRSGPGSVDRAGQLGPLRAWVGQHHDALASLLTGPPQRPPSTGEALSGSDLTSEDLPRGGLASAGLPDGGPAGGVPETIPAASDPFHPGLVLYAEWLYLTHTVAYDRLESLVIALDLGRAGGSFLTVDQRNQECSNAGLAAPPQLWRGVPHKLQVVEDLLGPSRHGPAPAEGVVVRSLDGSEPRVAKLVPPGFTRLPDAGWARGRPRNRLGEETSWR